MTASHGSCDFLYMHSDIPEGMTIREWRARRAANRPTRHPRRLRARAATVTAWRAPARALTWPRTASVRASGGRHWALRRAGPRAEVSPTPALPEKARAAAP